MSGPTDGKYLIILTTELATPPIPIGANLESGPISPVVSGGRDNVWTVRKLENGSYTLTLEQTGPRWLSKGIEDNVVVEIMPLPGEWRIQKQQEDSYSIEVPSNYWPTRAWTLSGNEPGTEVKLGIFELPRTDQLWKFNPVTQE